MRLPPSPEVCRHEKETFFLRRNATLARGGMGPKIFSRESRSSCSFGPRNTPAWEMPIPVAGGSPAQPGPCEVSRPALVGEGLPHHIPGCPRIGTALLKLTQIPNAGVFWRRLNVLPCRESASAKWLLGRLPLTVLATSIASPRRGPAPADLVIQASSQAVNGTQPAPQPRRIRLPRGDHGSPAEGGRRTPLLLPSEATLTSTWPTLLNSGADAWILSLDLPRPGLNSRRSAARCAPRAP